MRFVYASNLILRLREAASKDAEAERYVFLRLCRATHPAG
jgi:hypothetical protein